MRLLLVYVCDLGSISSPSMIKIQRGVGLLPSLGLMSLATYVEKRTAWQAEILDCRLDGLDSAKAAAKILAEDWEAVGISCVSHTWPEAWRLAKKIKEAEKPPVVIMGGPHATLYPAEVLSHDCIDYVILGEGEIPLQGLLERLQDWRRGGELPPAGDLEGVMKAGESLKAPFVVQDLDILPTVSRKYVRWREYVTIVSRESYTTTITSGRGCPYSCSFCWTAGGKKVRRFSPEHVLTEIEQAVELGIREFFFFDELFTAGRDWVERFCSLLLKRGLRISWDVRSRVDTVTLDLLKLMHKAGCSRVQYGAESGTDRVLKILGKGITADKTRQAIEWTRQAGLVTYADFMLGAPGETEEEMLRTIEFAVGLKLDYVHFSVLMLYPFTKFYAQALKQGLLKSDVWREYAASPEPKSDFVIPYWTEDFDRAYLDNMAALAYKRVCFRPDYIWRRLCGLSSWQEFSMCCKAALRLW